MKELEELEELYVELGPKVYAYLYMKTMNKHIAEELTQETFYQALRASSSFKGEASLKTWVFAIAKNVLRKAYRKNRYNEQLVVQLEADSPSSINDVETEIMEKSEEALLYELIQQLEEPQREIICLRIYGELSYKEIGAIFDKSENWARVNFQRAKVKLIKKSGGIK